MLYRGLQAGVENNLFTLVYPWISLVGGVSGIYAAQKWGGFKSLLGKTVLMFSLGLLFQFLGQAIYAYYIYINGIEVPYPSLGDIGYFGSVIFYINAAYLVAKLNGFHFSVRSFQGKFLSIIIPGILLISTYFFFLDGYVFDWSDKLRILLDFGYPFGEAIYVSFAILALLISRNISGGLMKKPILFLIFALVIQYFSDVMFLYQSSRETWYVGGVNDFMYLVSYFLMTLSLIELGATFSKISQEQ